MSPAQTSLKMLYWSMLIYDYEEVRPSSDAPSTLGQQSTVASRCKIAGSHAHDHGSCTSNTF